MALAHEGLERLRLRATDCFDRLRDRVAGIVRIDRGTSDGTPQRGEMLDGVRVEAARAEAATETFLRAYPEP
jgi:hypothetical protein